MLHDPLLIPPTAAFWSDAVNGLLERGLLSDRQGMGPGDFSATRIAVPGFAHARALKTALAARLPAAFVPPRIGTLASWLTLLPPDSGRGETPASERLMTLYAQLRQHGWIKKLFTARRNTDLLPLAQTLIALFDELGAALLPSLAAGGDGLDARWQAALEQLPPPARSMLSDEAQLVWTLWKSQVDGGDPGAVAFDRMQRLAALADGPLVWIAPAAPDVLQQAFLASWAQDWPVATVQLDWRASAIAPAYAHAWSEALDEPPAPMPAAEVATPAGILLHDAGSLEEEARHGAQTILDWLRQGCSCIAIVAQDRLVARRIRALLERAQVYVADETGWKLSTTRSAAALAALLDVAATRAETTVLLDLLKSPYLFADCDHKAERVMEIEYALRRRNVLGGWDAVRAALRDLPDAAALFERLAEQAAQFAGRHSLAGWARITAAALQALGMRGALQADEAGTQVTALLDGLLHEGDGQADAFSFAEWRGFLGMQLESTPFAPTVVDRRVVMLQLVGTPLRSFDAVLLVGADADHLPSQANETLFFANGVRRELGLATRESRQREQLRQMIELLSASPRVVLSWQSHRNGEPNAVSRFIERLQLTLERAGAHPLPQHRPLIALQTLTEVPASMPAPSAPQLLPRKLSASGYNSLVACPYQFFATRMLGLAALDELSDLPEKRDYGDWLHRILATYHETLRERTIAAEDRDALLRQISEDVFGAELARSAAALGYYARWQKTISAYLEWANEREQRGWRFVLGEQAMQRELQWQGGAITLYGRIDRIDENGDGERAVLDYKTRNVNALRERLKEGEDHQLAFYGVLSGGGVTTAHYVALESSRDKTGDAEARDYPAWQQMLEQQIADTIGRIARGAPLRASGVESICRFCDVRGLCRKGAW